MEEEISKTSIWRPLGAASLELATVGESQRGGHLIAEGRGQDIVDHLLMEDRGEAARDGGHDPGPVGRAAPPSLLLILQVLHEGGGGSMVVHDGHFGQLGLGRQGLRLSLQTHTSVTPVTAVPWVTPHLTHAVFSHHAVTPSCSLCGAPKTQQ